MSLIQVLEELRRALQAALGVARLRISLASQPAEEDAPHVHFPLVRLWVTRWRELVGCFSHPAAVQAGPLVERNAAPSPSPKRRRLSVEAGGVSSAGDGGAPQRDESGSFPSPARDDAPRAQEQLLPDSASSQLPEGLALRAPPPPSHGPCTLLPFGTLPPPSEEPQPRGEGGSEARLSSPLEAGVAHLVPPRPVAPSPPRPRPRQERRQQPQPGAAAAAASPRGGDEAARSGGGPASSDERDGGSAPPSPRASGGGDGDGDGDASLPFGWRGAPLPRENEGGCTPTHHRGATPAPDAAPPPLPTRITPPPPPPAAPPAAPSAPLPLPPVRGGLIAAAAGRAYAAATAAAVGSSPRITPRRGASPPRVGPSGSAAAGVPPLAGTLAALAGWRQPLRGTTKPSARGGGGGGGGGGGAKGGARPHATPAPPQPSHRQLALLSPPPPTHHHGGESGRRGDGGGAVGTALRPGGGAAAAVAAAAAPPPRGRAPLSLQPPRAPQPSVSAAPRRLALDGSPGAHASDEAEAVARDVFAHRQQHEQPLAAEEGEEAMESPRDASPLGGEPSVGDGGEEVKEEEETVPPVSHHPLPRALEPRPARAPPPPPSSDDTHGSPPSAASAPPPPPPFAPPMPPIVVHDIPAGAQEWVSRLRVAPPPGTRVLALALSPPRSAGDGCRTQSLAVLWSSPPSGAPGALALWRLERNGAWSDAPAAMLSWDPGEEESGLNDDGCDGGDAFSPSPCAMALHPDGDTLYVTSACLPRSMRGGAGAGAGAQRAAAATSAPARPRWPPPPRQQSFAFCYAMCVTSLPDGAASLGVRARLRCAEAGASCAALALCGAPDAAPAPPPSRALLCAAGAGGRACSWAVGGALRDAAGDRGAESLPVAQLRRVQFTGITQLVGCGASLVGVCASSGAVAVWDTHQRRLLFAARPDAGRLVGVDVLLPPRSGRLPDVAAPSGGLFIVAATREGGAGGHSSASEPPAVGKLGLLRPTPESRLLLTAPLPLPPGEVAFLRAAGPGRAMALAGGRLVLWRVEDGAALGSLAGVAVEDAVCDGRHTLATADAAGVVAVWDLPARAT